MNGRDRRKLASRVTVRILLTSLLFASPSFGQTAENRNAGRIVRVAVVSIPDRKVAVTEGGNVIATFQVAVGAAVSPSPTGSFRIVSRVSNPTYYHPGSVIPSGSNNPIGTRWLGLSQKGYGIHGTNAPKSVGHAASHGCIRLRNRDMERLFTMLRIGDAVEIHGERDEQVSRVFGTGADDTVIADDQMPTQTAGQ
ncbi:MAG: L,D-transpeptidase [Candidatus Sulfotelmatobacter sp.]|jgi:hypothetical protein